MRPTIRRCSALLAFVLLPGCGVAPRRVEADRPVVDRPVKGAIFCADGAGGFGHTTQALRQAVDEQDLPLYVHCLEWSHGYGRVLADQMDHCHVEAEGRRLAGLIADWRARYPGQPVYAVGHSAGTAVIVAAAAQLPPGSVERIVLLAPAVSAGCDLRGALACARQGVDVFYSERDWASLGLGVAIVGTTDRRWSAAAGRVGFRPPACAPADAALYAKLRQHAWDPCVAWSGNQGGHYGASKPAYLKAYVLPLFASARVAP